MRNQKGITLIALVITIIVLLILAGVSIAMLTGENGILTKATQSTVETARGEADEAVKLAISTVKADLLDSTKNTSQKTYKTLDRATIINAINVSYPGQAAADDADANVINFTASNHKVMDITLDLSKATSAGTVSVTSIEEVTETTNED